MSMNLTHKDTEKYLETIYLKASQLSTAASKLKAMVKGENPDNLNPFGYERTLYELKNAIDKAWDSLHRNIR